jgi:hypothetical protein
MWRRGSLTESNFTIAGILTALAIATASPVRGAEPGYEIGPARLDCRYSSDDEANRSTAVNNPDPLQGVLLPETDVFRPILADPGEPRFYGDYRRLHFRGSSLLTEGNGDDIDAGMVAAGGEFGLWGLRQPRGCDGLQVSVFGAAFAQFNLSTSSLDLLNADYLVGAALTYRHGRWSGRLRYYHQSSHLGDQFLLNYGFAHGAHRPNLGLQAFDLLISLEGNWWRLYGGGGLVTSSNNDPDLTSTPAFVEYGFELRGPAWARLRNSSLRPVFGASFSDAQATGWSLNASLEGGIEWSSRNATHRIRALLVAQRGALPFSQLFFQKTQNVGFQLEFEL